MWRELLGNLCRDWSKLSLEGDIKEKPGCISHGYLSAWLADFFTSALSAWWDQSPNLARDMALLSAVTATDTKTCFAHTHRHRGPLKLTEGCQLLTTECNSAPEGPNTSSVN